MISFIFEIIAAYYIMKIVNLKYKRERLGYLAFGLLLFIPTVIFNGSVWAQCDIIYTAFVIGSIYYILNEKPVISIIFYGIALSFKLQAIIIPLVSFLCYIPFLYNTGTDYLIDLSIVLFIIIIDLICTFRLHIINQIK